MKTLAMLALLVPALADAGVKLSRSQSQVLADLQGHGGAYTILRNDPSNPCQFQYDKKPGDQVSLDVFVIEKTDEYHKAGDIVAGLRVPGGGRLFDEADFSAVNLGWRTGMIWQLGLAVTHESTWDARQQKLEHTLSIRTLGGSELTTISILFSANGFTLDRKIESKNALNRVVKTTPAGHCEFAR